MTDLTRERIRVVTLGVAAALGAGLVRAILFQLFGTAIPFLPFLPAVIVAALWGGTRAGVVATLGSLLLAPLWMAPGWNLMHGTAWAYLSLFALTCGLMIWAVRQAHWSRLESAELTTRLAETEARFRHLADNIPQLAWMARPDGHLFWYNRRWLQYTGSTPEEMDGWGWQKVHDPAALPEVIASWKRALKTSEAWEHTFPLRRHDGVFRWFLSRAMPLHDDEGNVTAWFGSNTDITEQRENAEERRRLLESERAARSQAERASFLKDEFLATVSHELRTPLNAILGWTQLLRTGDMNDTVSLRDGLETIERNARAQTRIIEDLLEMSRIISGKTRLDVQPIDLVAIIESAIETLVPAAAAKQVRIVKRLDPVEAMPGDPARLQQVLWNLLANAIKFTPQGGRIEVVLARIGSQVEITVSDNGEGIASQFLPFVFDRFRQQDASPTRRHSGLGLGLSIVKNLVELHGGSVRVESAGLGQGSAFTVALPLVPLPREDLGRTPPAASRAPFSAVDLALEGVRVLVVDDERDSLELVRRLLQECEAEVLLASSAAEGLRIISEQAPDVIVSDIGMPEKDGLEMMRELRARGDQRGKTPAIALTAFARSEDRTRAMLAGFQIHLAKPVEPQELLAAVANLAGRTGSEATFPHSSTR